MHFAISFTAILGLLVPGATVANAQNAAPQKLDAAARAAAIGRFVDDQTVFVAHVDLTSLDLQGTVDSIATLLGVPKETMDNAAAGPMVAAKLAKVGATDFYFVFSLADFPDPGFAVLAAKPGIDAGWISQIVGQLGPVHVSDPIDGLFLLAGEKTLKRVQDRKPSPRLELTKAFEAAGDSTAQVFFVPSDDNRRVIRELLPKLPTQLGGGPTAPLVDGCLWAAVSVDLPPKKLGLRAVIQSRDVAAAKSFEAAISGLNVAIGKLPEIQESLPKFNELTKLLVPRIEGDRLELSLDDEHGQLKTLAALIQVPVEKAQASAGRARSFNNLKQLGLAMHNYYETKKSFPPAVGHDKNGKPLLSWRVHLLPFLDEAALYKEFHLDEPWDSEHNRKLIDRMPAVFRSPLSKVKDAGRTTYLLPVDSKHFVGGRESKPAKPGDARPDDSNALFFGGPKGGTFKQITDGTSNTIMIVEADDAHAVVWTRPDDLTVDLDDPLKGLENKATGGFNTAYFDGSVRFLPNARTKKNLRALLTPAGGEVVERE